MYRASFAEPRMKEAIAGPSLNFAAGSRVSTTPAGDAPSFWSGGINVDSGLLISSN